MSANKPVHMRRISAASRSLVNPRKCWKRKIRALSAIPQVMAFSEVYQALQTGVDGAEKSVVQHLCPESA
jgi:C4-dicarboxylate-binding protein DctP